MCSQVERYITCPNLVKFTKSTWSKLVERQKQIPFNLLKVRRMVKITCLKLVKVTSNLLEFYVDRKTKFYNWQSHHNTIKKFFKSEQKCVTSYKCVISVSHKNLMHWITGRNVLFSYARPINIFVIWPLPTLNSIMAEENEIKKIVRAGLSKK